MWRYLVGMLAGLLLVGGGVLWWSNTAIAHHPRAPAIAGLPSVSSTADDETPEPPAASEKTREQKRFARYDHDKDGIVSREEFLAARRKAFAKLDTNHNGTLDFDEYAVKTATRFADADADHDGRLAPAEFATTRIVRKSRPRAACPPDAAAREAPDES